MLNALLFSHLLGDYVFQTDRIAAWKSRSAWGVLAHGVIVTFFTWLCSMLLSPQWWPWALLIGATHTLIDLARTKVPQVWPQTKTPAMTLFLFLLDQALHVLTIVGISRATSWLNGRPAETGLGLWLQADNRLLYAACYVLLSMPAWVLIHFMVKGMGAESKSLPGSPGERYLGMLERGLIATFVLMGQYLLVPLVVTPRLALFGPQGGIETDRVGYLEELLISVALAVAVGIFMQRLGG